MENADAAGMFEEIADLVEIQGGNPFRVRSYRNAARTIKDLSGRVEDLVEQGEDLSELPHIGSSIADKIREMVETGTCAKLEELRGQVPGHLTDLLDVPRLGPKKAQKIHEELGVDNLDDLRRACEQHRVRGLEGMGGKTEAQILKGLDMLAASEGRILLKEASEQAGMIGRLLDGEETVDRWEAAGSFRRGCESVGDLDILVHSTDRAATTDRIVDSLRPAEVIGRGGEKVSVRLSGGLQVDFRFFEEASFGSALMYFTGSKAHNIRLRRRAREHDWKLSEYGLFSGDTRLAGRSEEAVYGKLGLPWIAPELREDRGEIEAAEEGGLPALIEPDDIRGDLHVHSTATDGVHTIEEMIEGARKLGYDYLAFCDHSQAVRVAGGLDAEGLKRHADAVREANDRYDDILVLAGVEVDILPDGSLDLDEELLAGLDWVTASIHYNFNLDSDRMTERLVRALGSGVVHALGHPLARHIGKREPLAYDFDRVAAVCAEHGVAMEINAQPERLDLPDEYARRAREAGAKLVIDTDAHSTDDYAFMRFGVMTARRAWLRKQDVVNAASRREMEKRGRLRPPP
ncbi:DNA polymerase/3'-5' exonuclease PolX [Kiritimatiella glycovorans]|uniref:DNA polymerase beta n=1 Tax=Kiritimatiella glycovorans TaxID=1307763 RepID=A0A0G3EFQ0_9BACT|nr:DNA polymerase/3'-5' exonuclease PolX [Kiritimatiella glycovorans]AKJ65291.1 DNA polymerase/3'-5' exonuclease PolX [Kiritimatiella glycovorans]